MSKKMNHAKKTVLFLCTGNSARSQMAEVLLRYKASNKFTVFSAGTHPVGVDSRTLLALEQFGLYEDSSASSQQLISKSITEFTGMTFDYVITLCDNASLECRAYSGAKNQLAWDFPDPKDMSGFNPFTATLHALDKRLSLFISLEGEPSTPIENKPTPTQKLNLEISPSAFYKCLTDDIRLKALLLTNYHGELCVCELMQALDEESQPKVSRNLAILKKAKIITDRKHGQWVFYRINPDLPLWIKTIISQTTDNNLSLIKTSNEQLLSMRNRPNKVDFCR